jgi:adenylate cyclase
VFCMLEIYYLPDERLVDASQSYTVLEASLAADIPHTHVCGGNARCSTCRVLILEGMEHCAPRTAAEQELAKQLHFEPTVRLACQTELVGSGKVTLRRLSLDADDLALFHDQAIGKIAPRFMGQEKHIAILFADIRGFTSFAEALLPYDVIYVLNRYFQRISQVICRHGGTINVYMGDGLMALFGVDDPNHAVERAIRAGVEMLEAVEQLNPSLEMLYRQRLRIGIGIHYGWAVIGTIGDSNSPNMTAIGDAVNFASRIEAANKQLHTSFLISADAYEAAKDQVVIRQFYEVQLPGKSGEYRLYEVAGIAAPLSDAEPNLSSPQPQLDWQTRIRRFLARLWSAIQQVFKIR